MVLKLPIEEGIVNSPYPKKNGLVTIKIRTKRYVPNETIRRCSRRDDKRCPGQDQSAATKVQPTAVSTLMADAGDGRKAGGFRKHGSSQAASCKESGLNVSLVAGGGLTGRKPEFAFGEKKRTALWWQEPCLFLLNSGIIAWGYMASTAIIIMICGDRIRRNMVTGYTVA